MFDLVILHNETICGDRESVEVLKVDAEEDSACALESFWYVHDICSALIWVPPSIDGACMDHVDPMYISCPAHGTDTGGMSWSMVLDGLLWIKVSIHHSNMRMVEISLLLW
jgi:hypothetical protein